MFVFTSVMILSTFAYGQEVAKVAVDSSVVDSTKNVSNAIITFDSEFHDFETIDYAGDGTHEFKFTNTGTTPLIISKAKGSCGCTVPTYPKDKVIKPGESDVIKVTYDTKRVGNFMKTVKITSNAKSFTNVLTIRGKVLPEVKEEVFPTNKSSEGGAIPFETH